VISGFRSSKPRVEGSRLSAGAIPDTGFRVGNNSDGHGHDEKLEVAGLWLRLRATRYGETIFALSDSLAREWPRRSAAWTKLARSAVIDGRLSVRRRLLRRFDDDDQDRPFDRLQRRTATMANSVATKNPLASTRRKTAIRPKNGEAVMAGILARLLASAVHAGEPNDGQSGSLTVPD
jgi:hypothetical protein